MTQEKVVPCKSTPNHSKMFVRKKRNRTGSISVVVIEKRTGKYKEIKNFGVVQTEREADVLCTRAREWISHYGGQQVMDLDSDKVKEQELRETEQVVDNIESVLLNAPQILLDPIYDGIGFNRIPDKTLRQLVIARICQPMSKLATVDYLRSHFAEDTSLDKIYYYMDKLYNTQQQIVQEISVAHTRKIPGGKIGIVFYDCTTIYFESFERTKLCEPGYSKDGKSKENQVVIGLLVSAGGYPLAYSVFCGSQYEGFTMLPVVEDFVNRFELTDFVVVADSGLMSKKNLYLLQTGNYKYIIGARIKNEAKEVRDWIISQDKQENTFYEYHKTHVVKFSKQEDKTIRERLITTYSFSRAKKDAENRQNGIEKLRNAYKTGVIKKESLSRRGYSKFLEISKDVEVKIRADLVEADEQWDGWKGYITNTDLSAEDVVSQYHELWVVERAFRVSKGNLEMRPVFHFTEKRIEAHICICFIAYKVYKEFERQLKQQNFPLSVDRVLEIAKTIPTIKIVLPHNQQVMTKTLFLTDEHRSIRPLFDL